MNKRFCRLACIFGSAVLLSGCGDKATKEALQKASGLENQKQYEDANSVLVDALRARVTKLHGDTGSPGDSANDELMKKVKGDPEVLKLERAQISLYLHLERPDLAAVVYSDILTGSPSDSVILDQLKSPDVAMRIGAVRILGLTANASALPALSLAARDSDREVRRAVMVALASIKDPAVVPLLLTGLKDSYWFTRSEAANSLGQTHDPKVIKPLLDAMGDSDSSVTGSVQSALLFLAHEPGIVADDFASRLNDPNPKVVLVCAVCLSVVKDPRAVPVLEKLVGSSDAATRLEAVKGLGESDNPDVIPTLRQTLKDPDVNMRGWSIIGLGILKDEGSLADLHAISDDSAEPTTIKAAADAAIGHINGDDHRAPAEPTTSQ